jgi:hypothetical protein
MPTPQDFRNEVAKVESETIRIKEFVEKDLDKHSDADRAVAFYVLKIASDVMKNVGKISAKP